MTTQVHTTQTMVAEFRTLLNSRYSDMVKSATMTKTNIITDSKFFAEMVMQYLGERKITKRFDSYTHRASVICAAADFATRCCHAPQRHENQAEHNAKFSSYGL